MNSFAPSTTEKSQPAMKTEYAPVMVSSAELRRECVRAGWPCTPGVHARWRGEVRGG